MRFDIFHLSGKMIMVINKDKLIRILHVVGGMNTGGVETWLMHVLRHMDRECYRFDFLTHTLTSCFYDEEIRSLGCRILPCPNTKHPWRYATNFRRILKANGPYDVAHSHSELSLNDRRAGPLRRLYLHATEWLIRLHATVGLACSGPAAAALYGRDWARDPRWRVLHYGICLEPFMRTVDQVEMRRQLGIPPDAFVVGHVGRFCEQKNHDMLMAVFAEIAKRESKARLLMVGDGVLRPAMERMAESMGLAHKVIFAGLRKDIAALMLGAMDVFLFPSRWEGLPVVLIEAQAAGLPCVISDVVPPEALLLPELTNAVSLKTHASAWAQVVAKYIKKTSLSADALAILRDSSFNITNCICGLEGIYSIGNQGGN